MSDVPKINIDEIGKNVEAKEIVSEYEYHIKKLSNRNEGGRYFHLKIIT